MFPEEKRWLPCDEHLLVAVPHMSSGACPASPRVHMLRKERGHQHSINTFGLLLDCTSRGVPSRSFLSARVHSRSSHCCPALLHMFGYCPCCSSRGTRNRNTMTKKHLYSKKKKKTWLTTRLAANWEWLISLFIILRILYNCTWWYREKYLDWIYVFRVPVPRLMIENDQERGHPNKGRPQLPTTQRNISAT